MSTDFIESIRHGTPLNGPKAVARSTLTAILGREVEYTRQALTWEELMGADQLNLGPESYEFG